VKEEALISKTCARPRGLEIPSRFNVAAGGAGANFMDRRHQCRDRPHIEEKSKCGGRAAGRPVGMKQKSCACEAIRREESRGG